jgi:hypothetical protein
MWQYQRTEMSRKRKLKETKHKSSCNRDTNVGHEMYDYTGNNWSQQNSNKWFKETFGIHIRKMLNRFTTRDSYTSNDGDGM